MHGYALVSMAHRPGEEWCGLEPALRHVSTVANMSRANSKSPGDLHGRIMEAEYSVRTEWAELGQLQPGVSLGAIIDVVPQRRSIWPLVSEFTRPLTSRGLGSRGRMEKATLKVRLWLRRTVYLGSEVWMLLRKIREFSL